jgi:HdeA/HdeB family
MTWLKCSIYSVLIAAAMVSTTRAQVMVDMSKFTCDQLMSGSPDAVEAAIWTSGYYNGLHKNTMLDMNAMKHNADAVVAACKSNPKKTVMQTVNGLLAAKKKK